MKSPKEDCKIRKSVVLDSGPKENLLRFRFFYTLFINNVFQLQLWPCSKLHQYQHLKASKATSNQI